MDSPKPTSKSILFVTTVLAISLLVTATANAMTLRELRQLERANPKQGQWYVQYYLIGVLEGLLEANAVAVRQGGTALFCLSDKRLDSTQAKAIFDAERTSNADLYEADMPVQLVMANALSTIYPCKTPK